MCRRCHNPTRNPSLSRARFDVDALDTLSASVLDRARERMRSPPSHVGHMPPRRFGQLTDDQVSRVERLFDELLARRQGGP